MNTDYKVGDFIYDADNVKDICNTRNKPPLF